MKLDILRNPTVPTPGPRSIKVVLWIWGINPMTLEMVILKKTMNLHFSLLLRWGFPNPEVVSQTKSCHSTHFVMINRFQNDITTT